MQCFGTFSKPARRRIAAGAAEEAEQDSVPLRNALSCRPRQMLPVNNRRSFGLARRFSLWPDGRAGQERGL
jgi:hypothetical protein